MSFAAATTRGAAGLLGPVVRAHRRDISLLLLLKTWTRSLGFLILRPTSRHFSYFFYLFVLARDHARVALLKAVLRMAFAFYCKIFSRALVLFRREVPGSVLDDTDYAS